MPKGVKIDSKKKSEIIASYALTNSYNATAKECKVSDKTVKKIVEANPKEYEQKKELFQDKANKIIDKALLLLERRFDLAIENEDELDELLSEAMCADDKEIKYQEKQAIAKRIGKLQINSLSEITTSMGTLYDKMRLANGESTNNDSFEVSIKVIE